MKNQALLRIFNGHLQSSLLTLVLINYSYAYIQTYIHQGRLWKLQASVKEKVCCNLIGPWENACSWFSNWDVNNFNSI